MPRMHNFQVRVYYEDTDFSGNVYHASFLKFFERARTEFLRAEGVHHSELARDGIAFAVRSMNIDFAGAAHIDDVLTITTEIVEVSGAKLTLDQTIARGSEQITMARVLVVAINGEGRATRLPKVVLTRFAAE
jgi:acyl-CoA thioester hydrolase